MSEKNFSRYELGRKTSVDILEGEKSEIDEVEAMLIDKKLNDGKAKNKHQIFMENLQSLDDKKASDIDDVKKAQLNIYASNSSDLFFTSPKSSIVFSTFGVIFLILFFAVVMEIVVLSAMGYTVRQYNNDDLSPTVESGTILFEGAPNYSGGVSVGSIITFTVMEDNVETTYTRIITEVVGTQITVNTPDGSDERTIISSQIQNQIDSVVVYQMPQVGVIILWVYEYWYAFGAAFLVLTLLFFIFKHIGDSRYNDVLLNKLDYERQQREKRRKYLEEDIKKMQESNGMDNLDLLSGLLNVNKEPKSKKEKKMRKLEEQLNDRRVEQIESIKENAEKLEQKLKNGGAENQDENNKPKGEDILVEGFKRELEKQEKEENALTPEEIAKKQKEAEEVNKSIGDN